MQARSSSRVIRLARLFGAGLAGAAFDGASAAKARSARAPAASSKTAARLMRSGNVFVIAQILVPGGVGSRLGAATREELRHVDGIKGITATAEVAGHGDDSHLVDDRIDLFSTE